MKIAVLTDNNSQATTEAEHGFSVLIEYDGKKILFDTGQSDMFRRNAVTMNLSLDDVDMIVLSHGHFDHGNGLRYLKGGHLICHPGCFVRRYRESDHSYIGLKTTREELEDKFDLTVSAGPYAISEKIVYLGEIPRLTPFESQTTSFIYEDGKPDFVIDDSAVAMTLPGGLFVVTGCGHSGVVNTLEHAVRITGVPEILGIMGGFHLKENDNQTRETIRYLKNKNVEHVLPSHCTSGDALSELRKSFGGVTVKSGDIFEF